jgi:hypothetical protein
MSPAVLLVWALTVRRVDDAEPKSLDDTHIIQLYSTEKSCNEDLADFKKNPTPRGPHFACVPVGVAETSVHEEVHNKSQN